MKPVRFVGSTRDDLAAFPVEVRARAGYELFMVQVGRDPENWKPMSSVGPGTCEIRVRELSGAYRVIYVAKFADAVYVLHAFQKKTQKTAIRGGKGRSGPRDAALPDGERARRRSETWLRK